ncbi:thiamine-phosphate kinase [Halosimplex aquaticum]|uniref:Thiamine-monophosphate kinase n=1 Tax=Halosimplex aquaticum TaxID=3026162 RepID=A0ABD5Y7M0_9EURY|nr:thiamine-phosphate kinase [Halosimplex aquaticum]
MDERTALGLLADRLPSAGDDAAVVDGQVVTTDMLHDRTDFPDGTTRYTAGWRAVGASLSDVAAMGAAATAAVAVYAAPSFDGAELADFVDGAADVCESVDAEYVGGDLDDHVEFTVATTALGETDDPVLRSGARPGEAVCVTGTLGRSAAALRLFERGEVERANALFRFSPRIAAGRALAGSATAMMDSSDGLARSLHQLAEASGCGMAVESPLPIDESVDDVAEDGADRLELGAFFGEDFELVCTVPEDELAAVREDVPVDLTRIGTVVEREALGASNQRGGAAENRVTLDGDALPDRGYTH